MVPMLTTYFNTQNLVLLPKCIINTVNVLLRINSDYFSIHHESLQRVS
jgi:hypothetical protein